MTKVKKKERGDLNTRFKQQGEVPKAKSPLSVRLPADLDELVRSIPNRSQWLQEAIIEKLKRETRG